LPFGERRLARVAWASSSAGPACPITWAMISEMPCAPLRTVRLSTKRADAAAYQKEADAVIGQQIAEQLLEIVRAAAESFAHDPSADMAALA
jgi:hypothetical protein